MLGQGRLMMTVNFWKDIGGIVIEDEAGCGGVLRDDKGVPYAMFSGLIEATGSGMAEELYRPWMLRNLFIGIDCGISQLLHAQFAIIHQQGSSMANDLAKASIKRSSIFKA
ncbi:hypothetical protein Goklo_005206 [Gossypium klotzschianum]|uniref:RNase H type-1 domain-containing protein n=1 Tax=Gossypium klotzschianum TaxID=34286 RepID=A0A7J8VRB3_9ROSI|nr:hypothetical protein [Gossypium klotzschianum]